MKAIDLHRKAEKLREEAKFDEALATSDLAIIAYQNEKNIAGIVDIQSSRFLIFKHLYYVTSDDAMLTLAKHSALSAQEIAEESKDLSLLSKPLFHLGVLYDEFLHDSTKAISFYKDSIDIALKHNLYSEGYIANMYTHLHTAEYNNGDKTSLVRLEKRAKEIEEKEKSRYERDVWSSGAYLRMAMLVKDTDKSGAKKYLTKAQEIIDSNPDLVIRKRQLNEILSKTSL